MLNSYITVIPQSPCPTVAVVTEDDLTERIKNKQTTILCQTPHSSLPLELESAKFHRTFIGYLASDCAVADLLSGRVVYIEGTRLAAACSFLFRCESLRPWELSEIRLWSVYDSRLSWVWWTSCWFSFPVLSAIKQFWVALHTAVAMSFPKGPDLSKFTWSSVALGVAKRPRFLL